MLAFKFNAQFLPIKSSSTKNIIQTLIFLLWFSATTTETQYFQNRKRYTKAKLLAFFQLTARGAPFIYQGEEIGMTQASIATKNAKDPLALKYKWIPQFLVNCSKESLNRDECRTPMQWDSSPNSGFCPDSISSWLPVNDNYSNINVLKEQSDSNSLWNIYRQLLQLRKQHRSLRSGSIEIIKTSKPHKVLAYKRTSEQEILEIVMNFSKRAVSIDYDITNAAIIYSTNPIDDINKRQLKLEEYSAVIIKRFTKK